MKEKDERLVPLSSRIPAWLRKDLEIRAKKEGRSVSKEVARIIKKELDNDITKV